MYEVSSVLRREGVEIDPLAHAALPRRSATLRMPRASSVNTGSNGSRTIPQCIDGVGERLQEPGLILECHGLVFVGHPRGTLLGGSGVRWLADRPGDQGRGVSAFRGPHGTAANPSSSWAISSLTPASAARRAASAATRPLQGPISCHGGRCGGRPPSRTHRGWSSHRQGVEPQSLALQKWVPIWFWSSSVLSRRPACNPEGRAIFRYAEPQGAFSLPLGARFGRRTSAKSLASWLLPTGGSAYPVISANSLPAPHLPHESWTTMAAERSVGGRPYLASMARRASSRLDAFCFGTVAPRRPLSAGVIDRSLCPVWDSRIAL